MDDDIVTTFHNNNTPEITIKETKLNTKTMQLPKLMREPL